MHKQEVVVCYMKLNINQFTFNRIVIRILKQFIYESRFFRTKLLTKRIQKFVAEPKFLDLSLCLSSNKVSINHLGSIFAVDENLNPTKFHKG